MLQVLPGGMLPHVLTLLCPLLLLLLLQLPDQRPLLLSQWHAAYAEG